jgi:hypothetical protein
MLVSDFILNVEKTTGVAASMINDLFTVYDHVASSLAYSHSVNITSFQQPGFVFGPVVSAIDNLVLINSGIMVPGQQELAVIQTTCTSGLSSLDN